MKATISKAGYYERFKKESLKETFQQPHKFLDEGVFFYNLDNDWVGETINLDEIDKKEGNAYLISSGTGSGKTTFVFEQLLTLAKKKRKKILVLCNRSALATHYKYEAMEKDEDAKKLKGYYTDKALNDSKINSFGSFDILTYQSSEKLKTKNINQYAYVVLDECHYFTSDATFNALTETELKSILKMIRPVKRIYMTATPQEVLNPILDAEIHIRDKNLYQKQHVFPCMKIYDFQRNYDYVEPHFMKEEDITQMVKEDSMHTWLIFVESKQKGREIEQSLNECLGKAEEPYAKYVDADSKNNGDAEIVEKIIKEEKIPCSALICTSVFDVGINIKNEFTNVIIPSLDKVQFLQMLGRKRVEKKQKIDLYVVLHEKDYISSRSKRAYGLLRQWEEEKEKYSHGTEHYLQELKFPFYFDNETKRFAYNGLAFYKKQLEMDYMNELLELSKDYVGDFKIFLAKQYLQWLGKDSTSPEKHFRDYIDPDDKKRQIKETMVYKIGDMLSEDEFTDLGEKLLEIEEPRVDKRKKRLCVTTNVINKMIHFLNLEIFKQAKDADKAYGVRAKKGK